MNMNAIHNILNILIAAAGAALIASGCVTTITGTLDCSTSWLDPKLATYAIMGMAGAKFVMNIFRDGIMGLWKPQPPVTKP